MAEFACNVTVGPPDDRVPDVLCDEVDCRGCGLRFKTTSMSPGLSVLITCQCGTVFEMPGPARDDGPGEG